MKVTVSKIFQYLAKSSEVKDNSIDKTLCCCKESDMHQVAVRDPVRIRVYGSDLDSYSDHDCGPDCDPQGRIKGGGGYGFNPPPPEMLKINYLAM